MRNIWRIFTRDVQQATRNVIAIIVGMGLVIVPALYAWYNIAASWDPYGNTKSLKVAVANTDKGYQSDLLPVPVNVGETVVSALRANKQLDWQFVSQDKAIDGVHSGEYYAALVIPKSFSTDMMTLFSPNMKHAELDYYLNEKMNPIAPHITDEGASTVADTIDRTFVTTLSQVAIGLASNVATYADTPQMQQYAANASGHLASMSTQLKSAAQQVDAYSSLITSTRSIIASTDRLIGSAQSAASDADKATTQASQGAGGLAGALSGASAQASTALKRAGKAYDDVSANIDDAFDDVKTQTGQTATALNDLKSKVQSQADAYGRYADSLRSLANTATVPAVKDALNAAADQASQTQKQLGDAATALGDAAQQVTDGTADVDATRADLKRRVADARKSVDDASKTYRTSLKPKLDDLASSMDDLTAQTGTVADRLSKTTDGMRSLSGGLDGGLKDAARSLADVAAALRKSAEQMDALNRAFTGMMGVAGSAGASGGETGGDGGAAGTGAAGTNADGTGAAGTNGGGTNGGGTAGTGGGGADDTDGADDTGGNTGGGVDLDAITAVDPKHLAQMISAPVSVDRKAIYPIANYGSAMAPFYTILSIWVGAIVLVAMMKVSISDHEKARILGLGNNLPLGSDVELSDAVKIGRAAGPGAMLDVLRKPHSESPGNARRFGLPLYQEYFGRYMIFGVLALLQGTLVCLGDLLYLGVQCEHPFLFMLTGWLAALVFSNIVYTLTVSFGDIGKAIAVVLLVMQVAGSGGTFPLETLPSFFQAVAKWLLFPYGVDAMHSAMAGAYGMEYWIAMGKLALFLVPSLLLGLVLRKPVIRLNDWIIRNLESTKVM